MAASTGNRNAISPIVDTILAPIAATTQIYLNQLVCWNGSGYITPAANTSGLIYLGISQQNVNNTGSAGAFSCPVRPPSGTDQYQLMACTGATQAWAGTLVYFVDDNTVAQSASNSISCGRVIQFISSTQVVVDTAVRS